MIDSEGGEQFLSRALQWLNAEEYEESALWFALKTMKSTLYIATLYDANLE